jgi:hypothetical protein
MACASWLQDLAALSQAYPALAQFQKNLQGYQLPRDTIREHYLARHGRPPGRCSVLIFHANYVEQCRLDSPAELGRIDLSASQDPSEPHFRLWIMEDMEREWLDALGERLDVDPLVLAEQMNMFHFLGNYTL